MLQKGDKAPLDIQVVNEQEKEVSLKEYKGKYIVLYFYPKDSTPGCTVEACSFRDAHDDIRALGVEVVGVSKDSIKSHKKFKEKHNLNFELWSDESFELMKAFGVWKKKKMMGREYMGTVRATFIINPRGEVVKVWEKVKPLGHSDEVLDFLKTEI